MISGNIVCQKIGGVWEGCNLQIMMPVYNATLCNRILVLHTCVHCACACYYMYGDICTVLDT